MNNKFIMKALQKETNKQKNTPDLSSPRDTYYTIFKLRIVLICCKSVVGPVIG